jgi:predicted nucleotidyltransferase
MKITGIISEYNPFHKGHEYQLQTARLLSGCDGIAAVMSGNFVQRGEPAIIEKHKRAVSAVLGGADIVIELPMPFSCQNAEIFAFGAVNELKKIPADFISFGCESGSIEMLKKIASVQLNREDFSMIVKEEIKNGVSYPRAVTKAIEKTCGEEAGKILFSPNNVLGIEYIKAALKVGLDCGFIPVKRIGSEHNYMEVTGHFDSASAVRKKLISEPSAQYPASLTDTSRNMLMRFYDEYGLFNRLDNYMAILRYKIISLGTEGINEIYDVSEGLNNIIFENAYEFKSLDEYIMSLKSKRYTYSRIRRIMLNILLDIDKETMRRSIQESEKNKHIKVLAFNDTGREMINEIRKNGTSVICRYSDYKKYKAAPFNFGLTAKATDIYYLPFDKGKINMEYKNNAVYVKS